jgi:hypothetical protein
MLRSLLTLVLAATCGEAFARGPYAVTVFGGQLLDNNWEQVFLEPHNLNFEDSGFVGGAGSARVGEPYPGLSLEIEGQIVRHFGAQTHWEINGPLATARWSRFPWNETVETSAAFGIGPSFASETPRLEVRNQGDSSATMVYWMIEVEMARPDSQWSFVGRLHHRSPAYGTFGEDGGSNALALGLRRRF